MLQKCNQMISVKTLNYTAFRQLPLEDFFQNIELSINLCFKIICKGSSHIFRISFIFLSVNGGDRVSWIVDVRWYKI